MQFTMNLKGQVNQMRLPKTKAILSEYKQITTDGESQFKGYDDSMCLRHGFCSAGEEYNV